MAGLIGFNSSLKTMSIGTLDQLMDAAAFQASGQMTPTQALTVPLAFRAIDMIAGAVSRMPYYIEDANENDVTEQATPRYWRDLQYKLCASLLLYNGAYALKERNRYGVGSYRFLPTPLVNYQINYSTNKIDYFTYNNGAQPQQIEDYEKRLLWWWWPNLNAEIGPGAGPMTAALGDVGLVSSLTKFAEAYFMRGGFPITLLQVEGNLAPDEGEKVMSWWNSMIAGARRAFRAILLTKKITPTIIGSNIKDTIAPDLYQQAAHNVSIAFGIPLSLLLSDAANYATALGDHVRFYTETVIPMAERVFEVWNERVYEPQGLTIETWPEQLEVMQSYQLEQAAAVMALVGKPILTLAEGRDLLGYEDMPEDSADETTTPEAADQTAQQSEADNDTAETDADMAKREDAIADERKRLKRYAHKRLRDGKPFAFASNIIGLVEIDAVKACATHDEIDALTLGAVTRNDDIAALIDAINAARADLKAAGNVQP